MAYLCKMPEFMKDGRPAASYFITKGDSHARPVALADRYSASHHFAAVLVPCNLAVLKAGGVK